MLAVNSANTYLFAYKHHGSYAKFYPERPSAETEAKSLCKRGEDRRQNKGKRDTIYRLRRTRPRPLLGDTPSHRHRNRRRSCHRHTSWVPGRPSDTLVVLRIVFVHFLNLNRGLYLPFALHRYIHTFFFQTTPTQTPFYFKANRLQGLFRLFQNWLSTALLGCDVTSIDSSLRY